MSAPDRFDPGAKPLAWRAPRPARQERSWKQVPRWALVALVTTLLAQIAIRITVPAPVARAEDLLPPPAVSVLRVLADGEPAAFAYGMALRLQAYDNQPGISIPFARLDYGTVTAWLDAMLGLDARSQYPMLMASHLYAQVLGNPDKQRQMHEFVYRKFLEAPDRRWPWLAHVTIMAKHRLRDLRLAIRYADAIRDHARGPDVPPWARQMHIFLREDVGEVESARALLGGLLDSGSVTDPHEMRFLVERLEAMGGVENSANTSKPRQ